MAQAGPLGGIRVLELGRMFAAPWAGQMLADMGAEVIKIESEDGDVTRKGGGIAIRDANGDPTEDYAAFAAMNRGKKSIVVNLKSPEGQDLVRRLAVKSDVLLENFKVGDLARLGLGYAEVAQENPRIVYLSLTGFGQTGPYRLRPGMDSVVQAMSGYLSLTAAADQPPIPCPLTINDMTAGMYAFGAIMTALYHRDTGGGSGQHIDLSLLDCGISLLSYRLQAQLIAQKPLPLPDGATRFAPSGIYDAQDGRFQISIGSNADFDRFCAVLERPDLLAAQEFTSRESRVENRHRLDREIRPVFAAANLQAWLERFALANIMFSPIYTMEQMMQDEQVCARDLFVTVPHGAGGTVPLIRNPIRMSKTPITFYTAPPLLGADTRSVLADVLDLEPQQVASLERSGAVKSHAAERTSAN
jgi:crotonobetainyl-CoA:carnitine CoA-transferase CaiB-like acyl-CoA transferase